VEGIKKDLPVKFLEKVRDGRDNVVYWKTKGKIKMISDATNPLRESRKESLLRCAGSTSICEWLDCDLVVICVQAVGDRALIDLCVCV